MYDAMMAETISITGHGGDQIEAYLARPLGPGPFGSVVVIHHMPGYDPDLRHPGLPGAVPDPRHARGARGQPGRRGGRRPRPGRRAG